MVFGLQTQPKSWLTGYTFWVNHYLEIVFSKISVVNPPPPPPLNGSASEKNAAFALLGVTAGKKPTALIEALNLHDQRRELLRFVLLLIFGTEKVDTLTVSQRTTGLNPLLQLRGLETSCYTNIGVPNQSTVQLRGHYKEHYYSTSLTGLPATRILAFPTRVQCS